MRKMKKLLSVLAITLAVTMIMSTAVFAKEVEDENYSPDENTFITYNLSTGESTEWTAENSNCDYIPPQPPAAVPPSQISPNNIPEITPFGYTEPWTRVTNVTSFPYSSIVHLTISFPEGVSQRTQYGTGFVVGNGKILTAAHCIQDFNSKKIATKITAYVSPNGTAGSAVYTVSSSNFTVNSQWANGNRDISYDYGIIKVNGDINLYSGIMGVSTSISSSQMYELAGFPNVDRIAKYNGYTMYKDSDFLRNIGSTSFGHVMNAWGGVSGSPVFRNQIAVGIHTRGDNNNVSGGNATRITSSVINLINSI